MKSKIIRYYLGFNFLFSFFSAFCHGVLVLMWKDIGLTFSQMAFLNGAFFLAGALFEFPTGVVADLFGRRWSIIFGLIIMAVAFLVYGLAHDFTHCLLAEILLAFGSSFISGSLDAWLKDSLDFHQLKSDLSANFSFGEIMLRLASALSGFIGAELGVINYHLALLASCLGLGFLAVLSVIFLSEDYFVKKKKGITDSFKNILVGSYKYGMKNKKVWKIIFSMSVMAMAFQSLNLQWSLVIREKLGEQVISYSWLAIKVFEVLGLVVVLCLVRKKMSRKKIFTLSNLLICGCILPMIIFENGWVILSFFLLHEIGRGMFSPIRKAMIQAEIPSEVRATIGSFAEMVMKVFMLLGWMLSCFLSDYFPYQIVWGISLPILFFAVFLTQKIDSPK